MTVDVVPPGPRFRAAVHSILPHGHGHVHTCGMEVCELTVVAIAAPVPAPWSLRRAQASTSPRRA